MPVFAAARALRYGFIVWLAVRYGRRVSRLWSAATDKYSTPMTWTLGILFVAGVSYAIWKFRRHAGSQKSESPMRHAAIRGH